MQALKFGDALKETGHLLIHIAKVGMTKMRPTIASLGSLITEWSKRTPTKKAISDGTNSFTYAALECEAVRIAATLIQRGVRPGDRIAVIAEKSIRLVPLMLGIWKAGAIYVPLDPQNPPVRQSWLVQDLGAKLLIGSEAMITDMEHVDHGGKLSIADIFSAEGANADVVFPSVAMNDIALIIYTSGSTGYPKGVCLEHGNVATFLVTHNYVLQIDHETRYLNTSTLHFSAFIMDVLLPLSLGAYVRISIGMPIQSTILRTIASERITNLYAVSSVLSLLTADKGALSRFNLASLRCIQFGGEVCDLKVLRTWLEALPGIRLVNGYGPTEGTVVCATYTFRSEEDLAGSLFPIGRAHAGVSLLLINDAGDEIHTAGVPGEVLIGGPTRMRGYWNQPQLTEQAFFEHNGIAYYKTGDIGVLSDDGILRYVGRIDDEVKILGRRINLNEIRRALLDNRNVTFAAVGTMEEDGRKEIIAVATTDRRPDYPVAAHIKEELVATLPAFMIPRHVLLLQGVSLSSTGKTNGKELLARLKLALEETSAEFLYVDENDCVLPLSRNASALEA